ncbi:MAG: hypothetical protein IT444_08790 [Phycisphaeraceae bacterium]|nr:hypothetical protein [Phycisphaeraceae bacterium]
MSTTASSPSTYVPPRDPGSRSRNIVGLLMLILMISPMALKLIRGTVPAPTSIEGFKSLVDALSVPELSLSFFFMPLFVLMLVYYRQWTKPVIALPLLIIFCLFYFGSMVIDPDYRSIITKADNVPITIMLLGTMITLWVAFREAASNDARLEAGIPLVSQDREDKVLVWPDLVYIELLCLVIAMTALVVWAIALPAPLESPANPAGPPNPSKAPWYFLGLQEMLVYFDPWMAGVLLPGLIVVGLIAMPYIDTNPKGNGYYTLKERKFAISVWLFGFLILWVVLIVFGTFLRGPNWNFFGPYQYWDSHLQVPLTNINLSEYFWNGKNLLGFGLDRPLPTQQSHGAIYPFVREAPGIVFSIFWIFILPVILAKTVFRRLRAQMGGPRFYVMAVLFVFLAMLPLKMVLRWLLVLKYFVYLPEFNLNL